MSRDHQPSRRQFLEQSMFAAAAAATAGSSVRVLAADSTASDSPNERLSVAVIGVRGRGTSHLDAFSERPGTEVTYICDPDRNVGERRCEETANRQGGRKPKFVEDMREVFDDDSVDIVTIATPNHWHALAAIWAIQAGKDVYVEKPVSHNVSEGRRIVEAARKHKRICQTGTQIRSTQGTQRAIDYLRSGKLGEVNLARGLCYKGRASIGPKGEYRVPPSVNYDLWLGPAETKPVARRQFHYDWHWFWDYGNGDLGNQGIHQMDVARWGLGVTDLGDSVQSYGGRVGYEDAGETANSQVSIHQFGDKRLVFEVRGLKTGDLKGAKVGNIFYGTDGYLVMTDYSRGAAFDPEGNLIEKFEGGGDHFGNFLEAVRTRDAGKLTADILEGHLSSALCHLGNISYRLGEAITAVEVGQRLGSDDEAQETLSRLTEYLETNDVPPASTRLHFGPKLAIDGKQEVFVDSEAANAMLSREYRAPFVVPAAGNV